MDISTLVLRGTEEAELQDVQENFLKLKFSIFGLSSLVGRKLPANSSIKHISCSPSQGSERGLGRQQQYIVKNTILS